MEYLIIFLILLAIGGKELAFAIAKKFGFINGVDKKVDLIYSNHLPHLEEKMDKVVDKLDKISEQNVEIITLLKSGRN